MVKNENSKRSSQLLAPGIYIRQSELLKSVPFSAATLWRMIARNDFVAPVKLSERVIAWESDAVLRWLDMRKAASLGGSKVPSATPSHTTEVGGA